MLAAARGTAGVAWGDLQGWATEQLKDLARQGKEIAEKRKKDEISEAVAQVALSNLEIAAKGTTTAVKEGMKRAAEEALNAALGVLRKALVAVV